RSSSFVTIGASFPVHETRPIGQRIGASEIADTITSPLSRSRSGLPIWHRGGLQGPPTRGGGCRSHGGDPLAARPCAPARLPKARPCSGKATGGNSVTR